MSVAWMKEGVPVTIRISKSAYNAAIWYVMEPLQNDRVKVVGHCNGTEKVIRVGVEKVWPSSLALREQTDGSPCDSSMVLNFQFDVPYHWKMDSWIFSTLQLALGAEAERSDFDLDQYLNKWIPIPGLGGSSILLRRSTSTLGVRPAVMYPRLLLLGFELWFHFDWYGENAQILEIDILKLCPAKHIWPFCVWCMKFHLPYDGAGSHRQSAKHGKARFWFNAMGRDEIRASVGFHNVQGRWL